jgi:hypothetical protein
METEHRQKELTFRVTVRAGQAGTGKLVDLNLRRKYSQEAGIRVEEWKYIGSGPASAIADAIEGILTKEAKEFEKE